MRRLFSICLIAAFFPVFSLTAQTGKEGEEARADEIFSLSLILEGADYAASGAVWRPDWPLDLPPDAFKVKSPGISRSLILGDNINMEFRFNREGRIEEFPFVLFNSMVQVSLAYRETGLRELVLNFPGGDDPWKLEFLESIDSYPSLVRCSRGEAWYFIALSHGVNEINETWYDEKGRILGAYRVSIIEIGKGKKTWALRDYSLPEEDTEYHYDSRGLITDISGPGGVYKVLYYLEDLPRYWEQGGRYSLQWDSNGLLLRIADENPEDYSGETVDYRYEYTLDEMGNWIERREIQMVPGLGLLVPMPGRTLKRILEYRE